MQLKCVLCTGFNVTLLWIVCFLARTCWDLWSQVKSLCTCSIICHWDPSVASCYWATVSWERLYRGPWLPSAPARCFCSCWGGCGTKATLFWITNVLERTRGKVSYVSDQESQPNESFISLLVPTAYSSVCHYSQAWSGLSVSMDIQHFRRLIESLPASFVGVLCVSEYVS